MTTSTLIQLQRKAESFVAALREHDPEAAERFDAYLERFWFDEVSIAEAVDQLRDELAAAIR